jgi:hypothetical protein
MERGEDRFSVGTRSSQLYSINMPVIDRWIDACMRQLRKEGWIHHLARHSTACFLTRGQCYISWERGMEVYDGENGSPVLGGCC